MHIQYLLLLLRLLLSLLFLLYNQVITCSLPSSSNLSTHTKLMGFGLGIKSTGRASRWIILSIGSSLCSSVGQWIGFKSNKTYCVYSTNRLKPLASIIIRSHVVCLLLARAHFERIRPSLNFQNPFHPNLCFLDRFSFWKTNNIKSEYLR